MVLEAGVAVAYWWNGKIRVRIPKAKAPCFVFTDARRVRMKYWSKGLGPQNGCTVAVRYCSLKVKA